MYSSDQKQAAIDALTNILAARLSARNKGKKRKEPKEDEIIPVDPDLIQLNTPNDRDKNDVGDPEGLLDHTETMDLDDPSKDSETSDSDSDDNFDDEDDDYDPDYDEDFNAIYDAVLKRYDREDVPTSKIIDLIDQLNRHVRKL